MSTHLPTKIFCHWSTMVDTTTNVAIDSNDQSHRVVIREWPDRLQTDVVHEQRVGAGDDWQAADLEEVHPLVHRGETTLCTWTKTRYDRGIAMASHRNDTEHRIVIRTIEADNGFEVVHERRGSSEDTWTAVDDHQITA
ncbi:MULTISPECIES: hypothetical protein [Halobacteriales]|jgi:hypothetical protein|uniref:hypothetical protein n=2 Tax=Halobacteria TaxID=183963 RepID=UPI000F4D28E4|nr:MULTISPECIES: hypothetical protein [Halobacteria]